jgi:pimeloyl-ACP methyl ester carboxylesterase
MLWFRFLRILIWSACGALFAVWFYWAFLITPPLKPDFVYQGKYLNVDGCQVHFLEKGMGPTVILLPGFPLNAESYNRWLEYPWKNKRVIALDLPEQGYSEKKGHPFSPEDFALTLKLFLDKLELQDIDLVGHDLGSGVAMVFAATYPHRVRKLVLLAPPLNGLPLDSLGPWWRWPLLGEVWSFFCLNPGWYRQYLSQGWSSPDTSWQPLVEQYFRPLSTFAGRRGFLAVLRGSRGYDYAFYQERLKVPTLVLCGENDPFCQPGLLGRLQAELPQISIKILPHAGHFLTEEAPQATYELMEKFLENPASPETASHPAASPDPSPEATAVEPEEPETK